MGRYIAAMEGITNANVCIIRWLLYLWLEYRHFVAWHCPDISFLRQIYQCHVFNL